MTFYRQLSQVFGYSGTIFNRPPGGTLLLRRLHINQYLAKYWREYQKTASFVVLQGNQTVSIFQIITLLASLSDN
jgi:hypothetical protein